MLIHIWLNSDNSVRSYTIVDNESCPHSQVTALTQWLYGVVRMGPFLGITLDQFGDRIEWAIMSHCTGYDYRAVFLKDGNPVEERTPRGKVVFSQVENPSRFERDEIL